LTLWPVRVESAQIDQWLVTPPQKTPLPRTPLPTPVALADAWSPHPFRWPPVLRSEVEHPTLGQMNAQHS
jgi:hypothetical protein